MTSPRSLAICSAVLPAATVGAQTQPVRVVNGAPVSATGLSGTTAWGVNLLAGQPLPPGASLSIQLGDGSGCRFALRLVTRDGWDGNRRNVDVCAERLVAMVLDPITPPPAPAAGRAQPAPATGGARPRP
jgi:hypothetical protein